MESVKVDMKLKSQRTLWDNVEVYFYKNSKNLFSYFLEQSLFFFFSWIPTFIGIGLRALIFKGIINTKGIQIIEEGVTFKRPSDIYLNDGVYIGKNAYIYGTPRGLFIGNNTRIMHNAFINVNDYSKFTPTPNITPSSINIGHHSVVGPFTTILGYGNIRIGNHVLISNNCSIVAYNHRCKIDSLIMDQGIDKGEIDIQDDVWIGANSCILSGVTIGEGSVVGAGSVVTKDIPCYSIAVGNPAKVIKGRGI